MIVPAISETLPHSGVAQAAISDVRDARVQLFVQLSGSLAILVGCLVVIGWIIDVTILKSVSSSLPPMRFNAAVCFIIAGAALLLLRKGDGGTRAESWLRTAGELTASVVILAGFLTATEGLLGWDLGIDQLFYTPPLAAAYSARMPLSIAIAFTCLGSALLLLNRLRGRWAVASQVLAIGANTAALWGTLDSVLARGDQPTGTSISAGFTMWILTFGVLLARPEQGFIRVVLSNGAGGTIARRLLAPVTVVPLAVGWLRWEGIQAGFYSQPESLSFMVTATTVTLIAITLWSALQLDSLDMERQHAEEVLRRASAYNRSLIEASMDPLVTISPDGKITDVNNATCMETGFSQDELIGTDFSDYFTEPEKAREGYQQVFREGKVQDFGLEVRHRDGHTTPVLYNASVYRDERGKIVGVFAAARNITERKRAEDALQRANAYNRSLIEASLDPLVTIAPDGKITDVNNFTTLVTGFSRKELIGTDFSDYFTEPERAREGYQQVFREGKVQDYGLEIRRRDGHITPVLYNASVYRDERGKIVGVFAAARDITERKQAEEQILKLNAELEERVAVRTAELTASNKELESFTYAVAHDLRAPLRHIQGFSSLLIADYASRLDESAQRYLERIQQGVERMARLLEDLLNLSRLGRQELRLQVCGLNSVIDDVLEELKPDVKDRQVEWTIGRLPYTECDPSLMKQVFANLLSNAVKFTRPREKAVIQVDQTTVEGRPAVFVRDNGVGFSMKYADKLFGIFQRLHRQEDFEGTGVGLATVHRIIDKHGGRVWAEAELDKGATFYFTLGESNGLGKNEKSSGGER